MLFQLLDLVGERGRIEQVRRHVHEVAGKEGAVSRSVHRLPCSFRGALVRDDQCEAFEARLVIVLELGEILVKAVRGQLRANGSAGGELSIIDVKADRLETAASLALYQKRTDLFLGPGVAVFWFTATDQHGAARFTCLGQDDDSHLPMLARKALLSDRFAQQASAFLIQRGGCFWQLSILIDDICNDICFGFFSEIDFHE